MSRAVSIRFKRIRNGERFTAVAELEDGTVACMVHGKTEEETERKLASGTVKYVMAAEREPDEAGDGGAWMDGKPAAETAEDETKRNRTMLITAWVAFALSVLALITVFVFDTIMYNRHQETVEKAPVVGEVLHVMWMMNDGRTEAGHEEELRDILNERLSGMALVEDELADCGDQYAIAYVVTDNGEFKLIACDEGLKVFRINTGKAWVLE